MRRWPADFVVESSAVHCQPCQPRQPCQSCTGVCRMVVSVLVCVGSSVVCSTMSDRQWYNGVCWIISSRLVPDSRRLRSWFESELSHMDCHIGVQSHIEVSQSKNMNRAQPRSARLCTVRSSMVYRTRIVSDVVPCSRPHRFGVTCCMFVIFCDHRLAAKRGEPNRM